MHDAYVPGGTPGPLISRVSLKETRMRFHVTQRQVGLALLGILAVLIFPVLINGIMKSLPLEELAGTIVAQLLALGLFVAYWRGFEPARHMAVILFTLLTAITLPDPFVREQLSLAVIVPPVLALVLASPGWVAGSAVLTVGVLIGRAGGGGVYSTPLNLAIYGMAIGGLILARLIADTAQSQATANAHRAEAALAQTEEQARQLADANRTMETQLNQQRQLLDLVTTLETPAIGLAEGVLLAPIVGHIDTRRAEALTRRLLQEAHRQRVRLIILDIAGVAVMDSAVAQALMRTVQALRLLGCEVTLSGISAAVATTMVHLGIDLSGVATARSPQEALALHLQVASTRPAENGLSTYN
jgi:anti-anti-sigma factor